MDDWQTQNKSVGCIPHLPSVDNASYGNL